MKTLGIDTGSANIGYALYDSELNCVTHYSHYSLNKSLPSLFKNFLAMLIELQPDKCFIEKPYFMHMTSATTLVWQVIGVQHLCMDIQNIDHDVLSPKTVKKQFTGSGNASKQDVIDTVKFKFNIEITNNHIADAIAVAYVGTYHNHA